jgi:hypothetical protein
VFNQPKSSAEDLTAWQRQIATRQLTGHAVNHEIQFSIVAA